MSAILHNYSMEYCKCSRISLFECAILTQSALYLTCECALLGTRYLFIRTTIAVIVSCTVVCLRKWLVLVILSAIATYISTRLTHVPLRRCTMGVEVIRNKILYDEQEWKTT